eukprot:gene8474-9381_t
MDSNMNNDSSNKLAKMDKSSSEEVRMEEKMNQDFQRMNAVLTYHKNKREGLSQVYPDHYNKKEKDSLRRYANNYELESEYLYCFTTTDFLKTFEFNDNNLMNTSFVRLPLELSALNKNIEMPEAREKRYPTTSVLKHSSIKTR